MNAHAQKLSPAMIVKLIETDLGPFYFSSTDRVAVVRGAQLKRVRDFLIKDGFPDTDAAKLDLSLIPYVFQEANYDDISWTDREADLGHLKKILDIDFLVQSGGMPRLDVSDEEFHEYVKRSFRAIDKAKGAG